MYCDSIPNEDNIFNYNITDTNKSLKQSFQSKNSYLISIRSSLNSNKKYRKIDLSNFKKINRINNKSNLYENKTNVCRKKNMNSRIDTNMLKNKKENYESYKKNKLIQKTNSIKSFLTNDCCRSKSNTNTNQKKYFNEKIKFKSSIKEINSFIPNKNLTNKGFNISSGYLRNNYFNQTKNKNNNYIHNSNIEGVSLKFLIQEEKLKNSLKQKKLKDINKEKVNLVVDNIFNNKSKKTKNNLMIETNDYSLNLYESQNNIRIKGKNYSTINNHRIPLNKNIKSGILSHYINKKGNKINVPKHDFDNNDSNPRTITLTDNQRRQRKRYLYNKSEYILNKINNNNNNNKSSLKHNLTEQNKNNKIIKEKNLYIPAESFNKIYILNKISESKRKMKNILLEENNYQTILNNHKQEEKPDFNKTENDEKEQIIIKTEVLPNNNKFNLINNIKNKYQNHNNFSLKGKNLYEAKNKRKIVNYKILDDKNRKIRSKQIDEIENFEDEEYHENKQCNNIDDKDDLSVQSLSDSKVLEMANTFIDDQVDKNKISDILENKRKQNIYS